MMMIAAVVVIMMTMMILMILVLFFQLSYPRFMFPYLFALVFLSYNVSFSWICGGCWLSIYMRVWIGKETGSTMLCGERGMHFRICRDLLIADRSLFFATWHFSLFFLSPLFLFKRSFGGEEGMWVDLFWCLKLKGQCDFFLKNILIIFFSCLKHAKCPLNKKQDFRIDL